MRALWLVRHGGGDAWAVRETPDPVPQAGEVRIRVHASGLNFSELMARQGLYPDAPKPPAVLGYEASGVIDAVGEGVDAARVGQRVVALAKFGAHAELLCVQAGQALPIPEQMPFEAAAALPLTYLTAYHMLFRAACLRPGESVLVHMAAGGVGTAVLQLCRTVERVTTFGTASSRKHGALRANGCTYPIDYHAVDYAQEVRRLSDGRGVDIVLDPLGGRDTVKGYKLLRPGGRIVVYGFANIQRGERRSLVHVLRQGLAIPRFSPLALMAANRGVIGVNVGHLWGQADLLEQEMAALIVLYNEGKIVPVIDVVLPLERAAEGYRRMETAQNVGKIIVTP
ncbi:alcohol dehydrogenase [bacterium]|nr:MAG: alcohol dehydrogenase [bacterium]